MKSGSELMFRVSELTLHSLNGTLDEQRMRELEQLLEGNPTAVDYYVEILWTHVGLNSFEGISSLQKPDRSVLGQDFWMSMLQEERTAPAIEIERPRPEKVLVKVVKAEKTPRVINKFSLYSAILSMAAVVFLLIYIHVVPPRATSVATITDGVNAQWEQGGRTTEIGDRLWNNEGPRWLKKGTVKIAFDYGAEVIVEGPAEFEMESPEKMQLYSGRLYAQVPKGAAGFTVQTPYSTVIDLGTEFGVKVDFDGSTDVHMFKGKASLIPGSIKEKKESVQLTAGQAKGVLQTGVVQKIQLEERLFVRRLDSKQGFIWRGQNMNLADIVGGGNGFGTGKQGCSIDPVTGMTTSDFVYMSRQGQSTYVPVDNLTYVDGVFVPDGGNGPIQINSEGDLFEGCIDTSGRCFRHIANGFKKGLGAHQFRNLMNGVEYGTVQNPAISMHSNTGLTFDLDEIRAGTPGVSITAFSALCGISGNTNQLQNFMATFYVLVDGEKKYEITARHKELLDIPVRIELSDQDRFLTLIAADGGDTCPNDWCTFALPFLEFELIQ